MHMYLITYTHDVVIWNRELQQSETVNVAKTMIIKAQDGDAAKIKAQEYFQIAKLDNVDIKMVSEAPDMVNQAPR